MKNLTSLTAYSLNEFTYENQDSLVSHTKYHVLKEPSHLIGEAADLETNFPHLYSIIQEITVKVRLSKQMKPQH